MASSALQDVGSLVRTFCAETSPDSKCPICLDVFNNVSYAASCFHRFCFCCILEWGKNKAECPLCKQPFSAVYHSVCSEFDFRLYRLPPPAKGGSFGDVQGRRFRYRTTLTHRRRRERRSQGGSRPQEVMRFRHWLYRHDVRVRRVRDDGRSRDTSAEFFRKNPACLHRLVPWLKRELAVLCESRDSRTDVVLHAILTLITRYDMQDESFLRKLRPFLSTRTEHFLHEFLSFAKSPFNMEAYDRHAVYDCPAPSRLSAVSEDDADLSSAPSPWDDETPGPSYSSGAQHVYTINVSDSDVDSASEEEEEPVGVHANANGGYTRADDDDDESSSDEDCVIIGFIKPSAQRTPELVQLSSDSEVSVKEEPEPSTSTQSGLRDRANQRPENTNRLFLHSDNKHNCGRNWGRNWERSSKVTNHSSQSHTSQNRHSKYTDTQLSHTHTPSRTHRSRSRTRARSRSRTRARSRSRTRARSRSRTRARSRSRTRARSRSRTRARSYGGSWRMQASPQESKSESLHSSHRITNYYSHCGEQKHKSLHSDKRRRGEEENHHHHHSKKKKKKKKKQRRERSCSMKISAEKKKHHKTKKKHKSKKRSGSEQTGQISGATSPAVIIIHTDTEVTPPKRTEPPNTEERTTCST